MINKRAQCDVAIIFVTLLVFVSSLDSAHAETYTMDATIQQGLPISIHETERVMGNIDFGHGFSSIESISVNMAFGGDGLYFPTDTVVIGFPSQFGYMGTVYPRDDPWDYHEYSFDATEEDSLNALLDGSTGFYIEMLKGSVDITRIIFQVTGTAGQPTTYTLKTSVIGGNGAIVAIGASLSDLFDTFYQGTVLDLIATPDSGYQVKAWTGTDDDTSKSNTNTVTMNESRTVKVEFETVDSSGGDSGGGGCFISTVAPK